MTPTIFRLLVVLSCSLTLVAGFVDVLLPELLEPSLRDLELPTETLVDHWWVALVLCAFVAAVVVSTVGLLRLKPWARRAALVCTIAGFFVYPFLGSVVLSGPAASLSDAGCTLCGVVMGAAYWSPVARRFQRGGQGSGEGGGP